jgi:hypothetical protein
MSPVSSRARFIEDGPVMKMPSKSAAATEIDSAQIILL